VRGSWLEVCGAPLRLKSARFACRVRRFWVLPRRTATNKQFVALGNLETLFSCTLQVTSHKEFKEYPEHSNDAILLVKQFMSSRELSQPPMLLFPYQFVKEVAARTLTPVPRKPFTSREKKEFLKTAEFYEQEPWGLKNAAKYLKDLVHNNAEGKFPDPPTLTYIFNTGDQFAAVKVPPPQEWLDFADTVQARVIAVGPPVKQRAKAKAAAARAVDVAEDVVDEGAAAPKPKGKAKAKAKAKAGTAKAKKAAAKAATKAAAKAHADSAPDMPLEAVFRDKRRRLPPPPPGVVYGCPKCRKKAAGCSQCRGL